MDLFGPAGLVITDPNSWHALCSMFRRAAFSERCNVGSTAHRLPIGVFVMAGILDFDTHSTAKPRARRDLVLNVLSNIWTGIGLMIAIIVYSALGSAIPPLRQYFEMS